MIFAFTLTPKALIQFCKSVRVTAPAVPVPVIAVVDVEYVVPDPICKVKGWLESIAVTALAEEKSV